MAPGTPLVAPRAYYERSDRPSLVVGTAAVLARGVVFAVATWWFVETVLGRIETGPGTILGESVANHVLFAFVVPVIGWLLLAVCLHVFVWFADGNGAFPSTVAVVGEAELVSLLLVPVVAFVFVTTAGDVPADPVLAVDVLQETAALQTPLLILAGAIGTVWQAAIAGVGLSTAHGIAVEKTTALTVVVGLLAYVGVLLV